MLSQGRAKSTNLVLTNWEIAMKNLTTMIAVASFALSVGTIARADSTPEFRSVTVKYADVNTANDEGAALLYQRLASAAKSVCRDFEPGRRLELMAQYKSCVHNAISNAVADVDSPAVTAYAAQRGVAVEASTIKIARNN
jgi:UrcA family protein